MKKSVYTVEAVNIVTGEMLTYMKIAETPAQECYFDSDEWKFTVKKAEELKYVYNNIVNQFKQTAMELSLAKSALMGTCIRQKLSRQLKFLDNLAEAIKENEENDI